jgi:hypothetical protein
VGIHSAGSRRPSDSANLYNLISVLITVSKIYKKGTDIHERKREIDISASLGNSDGAGGQTGCSHRIYQTTEMQENFRLPLVFQKSRQSTADSSNAENRNNQRSVNKKWRERGGKPRTHPCINQNRKDGAPGHGTSLKENGGPKPAVIDPFSAMTRRSELPANAPHDTALQPEVVL